MEKAIQKVSVVLTTYNGIKYLNALLDSLRLQTRKIDEVWICDDGSSDGTKEFVVKYIKQYQLESWKLILNPKNIGWKKNFKEGILKCNGDVIFPCDQDDIWELNKVERMLHFMENNPNILLLSSDYTPIYEENAQNDNVKLKNKKVGLEKIEFDNHFAIGGIRPGCVMAIQKNLVEYTKDIWLDWYPHDAFLWIVALIFDGCYIIHEPLIKYRRHSSNTSSNMCRTKIAHLQAMERTKNVIQWYKNGNFKKDENKETLMNEYLVFAKLRKELLENKKIINCFKLIRYRKFYRTVKQELGDLYLIIHS